MASVGSVFFFLTLLIFPLLLFLIINLPSATSSIIIISFSSSFCLFFSSFSFPSFSFLSSPSYSLISFPCTQIFNVETCGTCSSLFFRGLWCVQQKTLFSSEICCSHGTDFEDYCLLGCDALWSRRYLPTFWWNLLLASGWKSKATASSKILVTIYHTTQCHIPEDGNLHSHCHKNLKFMTLCTVNVQLTQLINPHHCLLAGLKLQSLSWYSSTCWQWALSTTTSPMLSSLYLKWAMHSSLQCSGWVSPLLSLHLKSQKCFGAHLDRWHPSLMLSDPGHPEEFNI